MNEKKIRQWMKNNSQTCRDNLTGEMNNTMLAEQAAEEFDLYEGDECKIPDEVFDIAAEFT